MVLTKCFGVGGPSLKLLAPFCGVNLPLYSVVIELIFRCADRVSTTLSGGFSVHQVPDYCRRDALQLWKSSCSLESASNWFDDHVSSPRRLCSVQNDRTDNKWPVEDSLFFLKVTDFQCLKL